MINFEITDFISRADAKHLWGWDDDVFGISHYHLTWRDKDWHIFARVEEELVGHASVLEHTVNVGGLPVVVGGLGSVVTLPQHQHRGYAKAIVNRALNFMCHDLGVEFAMGFCREELERFYTRLGWGTVAEAVFFEQPSGRMRSPLTVIVKPCGDRAWPPGEVELHSLPW
jgi:GNAT superfamily N-acetyltransferase